MLSNRSAAKAMGIPLGTHYAFLHKCILSEHAMHVCADSKLAPTGCLKCRQTSSEIDAIMLPMC